MELTMENFDQEVRNSEVPVLVDFWAPWCGPCKMVAPVLEELSKEAEGYKIRKIDVENARELAQEFGILSIPTLILFKDGVPVEQVVGVQSKEAIKAMVEAIL